MITAAFVGAVFWPAVAASLSFNGFSIGGGGGGVTVPGNAGRLPIGALGKAADGAEFCATTSGGNSRTSTFAGGAGIGGKSLDGGTGALTAGAGASASLGAGAGAGAGAFGVRLTGGAGGTTGFAGIGKGFASAVAAGLLAASLCKGGAFGGAGGIFIDGGGLSAGLRFVSSGAWPRSAASCCLAAANS